MGDNGWQFVVGLIVGFLFNWLLNLRNQHHERQVAAFNIEVEELKSQLALLDRSWRVVERARLMAEDRVAGEGRYSDDDKRQLSEDIFDVHLALSSPSLTTSSKFDMKWEGHYQAYSACHFILVEGGDEVPAAFGGAYEAFHLRNKELKALIKKGMENFKAGRSIYPG